MHNNNHIENNSEFKGLKVNNGVEQPPIVNPNPSHSLKRKKKKIQDVNYYVNGILEGNRVILSQAVTLIESSKPLHQNIAQEVIMKCLPHSGKASRIGITGVPGAGKSTFIEAMGMHLVNNGNKLAVLAIDPSSERTKGSILGDKTRMEQLSAAKNAYIRPSPSAGSLGGVARKTRETVILCEAAGFNTIFIETVGVGQSETAVHSMVDYFLLVQIAGAGDELQGIKRGIMEMSDGIVINKADGSNIEKAKLAQSQLKNALHFFPPHPSGWAPKVETCSSINYDRIEEVWKMITEYLVFTKKNGYFDRKRNKQSEYWMFETINEGLKNSFYNNDLVKKELPKMKNMVVNNEVSSFAAANELLELYKNKK